MQLTMVDVCWCIWCRAACMHMYTHACVCISQYVQRMCKYCAHYLNPPSGILVVVISALILVFNIGVPNDLLGFLFFAQVSSLVITNLRLQLVYTLLSSSEILALTQYLLLSSLLQTFTVEHIQHICNVYVIQGRGQAIYSTSDMVFPTLPLPSTYAILRLWDLCTRVVKMEDG